MNKSTLTEQDYINAARDLGCEVAALKAIAFVEAGGVGFLPDGQSKILFERHVFSRLTNGRFDKTHPDLSNPKAGGYVGDYGEHARLQRAEKLDKAAARMAASWGKFQLLGEGYKSYCGYSTLQAFITDQVMSEQGQIKGFLSFIKVKGSGKLWAALKAKDWATVAYYYNGKGYAKHQYDVKLAQAYQRFNR